MQLRDLTEKCFGVELSLKGFGWLIARDLCVFLCHPSVLWCQDFSPRPQYVTCGLLGPLILSVTLLLATFPGEEECDSRPRCGPNELFWKWQQPALSSSLPENTQHFPLPHRGGSNHGAGLKPGKAGGQKLTAATSGKARSGQPFALRIPKVFRKVGKGGGESHRKDGIFCLCPVDSIGNICSSSPKPIAGVVEEESCCSVWTTLNRGEEPRRVCPQGLVANITGISLWSRENHPMQIPLPPCPLGFCSSSHNARSLKSKYSLFVLSPSAWI